MNIDIDNNILRERSTSSSCISLRESSTHSAASSLPYHKRMEIQNNNLNENKQNVIKEISLSYATVNNQNSLHVRQVTDNSPNVGTQHVINEVSTLNNMPTPQNKNVVSNNTNTCLIQNVFNVQLPYDINQSIELTSWDGNAYPISLYGLLEHLNINMSNIKISLLHMADYVKSKKIELKSVNDVSDLNGLGEVVWLFILFIYKSGWDLLYFDK